MTPEEEGLLTLQNDFSEALEKNNIGYCRCDVTSENEFDAAFVKCIEKMGETPDVLINAAGILGEEQWENLYDINLVRLKSFQMFYHFIYNSYKRLSYNN